MAVDNPNPGETSNAFGRTPPSSIKASNTRSHHARHTHPQLSRLSDSSVQRLLFPSAAPSPEGGVPSPPAGTDNQNTAAQPGTCTSTADSGFGWHDTQFLKYELERREADLKSTRLGLETAEMRAHMAEARVGLLNRRLDVMKFREEELEKRIKMAELGWEQERAASKLWRRLAEDH